MSTAIPLFSNVQVAAPCAASWKHMDIVDGDRVHFCAGCKKNVYNLSAMTQTQAEGLQRKHEGHLCVRYYKRTDGTVLTQNCPVGQAALRMKMIARSKRVALATAAFISLAALADVSFNSFHRTIGSVEFTNVRPLKDEKSDAFADAGVPIMGSPAFEPARQHEVTPEQRAAVEKRVLREVNEQMRRLAQAPNSPTAAKR